MKKLLSQILLLLLISIFSATSHADLSGTWEGELEVNGTKLPLVVHINNSGPEPTGTLDSPAQGAFDMPMSDVTHDNQKLSFKVPSIGAYFEGKLDAETGVVSGNFIQGGVFKLSLTRLKQDTSNYSDSNDRIDVLGDWYGAVEIPGSPLAFVLHIKQDGGSLQATADSPDQGANGLTVDEISLEQGQVTFKMVALGASYSGMLTQDKTSVIGKFKQQGMEFKLDFARGEGAKKVYLRPQEPAAPFAYHVEDVVVINRDAGIELAGTLTRPTSGIDVKAAAILITGSGPQDRDETIFKHKPFWVIADYLAQQGYAVLRMDDRGVGDSEGDFSVATSEDFVTDISAAVDFLQQRDDLPDDKIGLIGHSEGGMIAPMLAAERDDLAFIVLMAGPGVPITELLAEQKYLIGKSSGLDEVTLQQQRAKDLEFHQNMVSWRAQGEFTQQLTAYLQESLSAQIKDPEQLEKNVAISLQQNDTPWFKYFIAFNPDQYLSQVKVPVLAINGEKDVQVAPKSNLDGIGQSLAKAGNKDVSIKELADLNHLFQTSKTGAITEYINIEESFSPVALKTMSDWLNNRF